MDNMPGFRRKRKEAKVDSLHMPGFRRKRKGITKVDSPHMMPGLRRKRKDIDQSQNQIRLSAGNRTVYEFLAP